MKIDEATFNLMPPELRALFNKLPNPGSDEVLDAFPSTKASRANRQSDNRSAAFYQAREAKSGGASGRHDPSNSHDDSGGSAARFFKTCPDDDPEDEEVRRMFYCGKATRRDRDEGLDGLPFKSRPTMGSGIGAQPDQNRSNNRNTHPTVKPTKLMRYLCRIATPAGGTVLDPFMGSGSTGKAARLEGFDFVGIEMNESYFEIAVRRIG